MSQGAVTVRSMRLLHTSDWHLGRTFHGAPLLDHQVEVLDALVAVVRDEGVDVVVVAGDVYDRQIPSVEATQVLSDVLGRLRDSGAVVVATAGNHDSPVRLGFAARLLARQGVHLRGDPAAAADPVVVPADDGGPDLLVYPVPYLEPEIARHALDAPEARSHEAVLALVCDRARADARRRGGRSVLVAHAFVAGGTPCDSERVLRVGGSDRVGPWCFKGFDYVALGHLHGRQTFAGGRIRYAGSPLAYSFSERAHTKGVWLVDFPPDPAATPRVRAVDLPVPRRLATLTGTLDELLSSPHHRDTEDCWVAVTLTDQVLPRDAMRRLRARFPHTATLVHEPPLAPGGERSYRERVRGRGDVDLVADFVAHVSGQPLDEAERAVCLAALDAVARDGAA